MFRKVRVFLYWKFNVILTYMNQELIERYLRGQVTAEERESMEKWVIEQGNGWLERFIDEQWKYPEYVSSVLQKNAMKSRVLEALKEHPSAVAGDTLNTPPAAVPLPRSRRLFSASLPWMAAACILLIAGLWFWKSSMPAAEQKTKFFASSIYRNDSIGKIRVVRLPDGTVVTLNVFSTLQVAADYNKKTREIMLSGEAFFEVTHNVEHPFIVHAAGAATRVYGTAFNISAYPRSCEVRVGLQKGRIGVTYAGKQETAEKILAPGQLLIYDKTENQTLINEQSIGEIGAWRNGGLVFYKTPLKDVLEQLENKYGVKFSYPSDLNNQTITASFEGSSSMNKVLAHLSFVWNIHFQQEKDSIYVK